MIMSWAKVAITKSCRVDYVPEKASAITHHLCSMVKSTIKELMSGKKRFIKTRKNGRKANTKWEDNSSRYKHIKETDSTEIIII